MEINDLIHTYHRAWASADLDTLKSTLADDFATYMIPGDEVRDTAWELDNCQNWHDAFPDTAVHIEQIVVQGDRVAVYWRLTATHTGDFMGMAATDKAVKFPGMEFHRIAGGKIAETWRLSDTMTLMQQLDAL